MIGGKRIGVYRRESGRMHTLKGAEFYNRDRGNNIPARVAVRIGIPSGPFPSIYSPVWCLQASPSCECLYVVPILLGYY